MFSYKKIVAIVTSVLYIFVNYDFYNSIFHEYTNDRLFHTTTYLGIVELVFFIMLFLSVFQLENMETKKHYVYWRHKSIIYFFINNAYFHCGKQKKCTVNNNFSNKFYNFYNDMARF